MSEPEKVKNAAEPPPPSKRSSRISGQPQKPSPKLYGNHDGSALVTQALAKARDKGNASNVASGVTGVLDPPVNLELLKKLRIGNPHHAACILAKVNATTGLGFKSPEVEKKLGPITDRGFRNILVQAGNDFEDNGNGYLEVVRKSGGGYDAPTGIHYAKSEAVRIYVEESQYDYHFEVTQADGKITKMPRYGDKKRFMEEVESKQKKNKRKPEHVSELIHFWMPNGLCSKYGVPDWLACIPLMDLVQTQNQYWYDFFQNWGSVAKLISIISNDDIDDAVWRKMEEAFQATVKGDGAFKSFMTNLVGQDIKVQVDDLGADPFSSTAIDADRNLALDICAAHRTDPMIAQVIPSSRTTSANKGVLRETVQLFQAQTIGIRQLVFQETLERTLGQDFEISPTKGVKQEISGVTQELVSVEHSGWAFKTLMDEMEFEMTPQLGGPQRANGSDQRTSEEAATQQGQ